jgi:prepilin-type N-terminal cleavage/methylation domain-containing protein
MPAHINNVGWNRGGFLVEWKNMKNKAFTLIELLVVIAIIGVMASIVLVNLSGTREKAMIARGLQFSNSLNNALGADAVGIWSFDAVSGNTVYDLSGYGQNGTLVNSPAIVSGVIGNGVKFDANGELVRITNPSRLNVTADLTIETWINPDSIAAGAWHDIVGKGGTRCNYQFSIVNSGININRLAFDHCKVDGSCTSGSWDSLFSNNNNDIKIGVWQHVAVTVIGNTLTFYRNGVEIGIRTFTRPFWPSSEDFSIGGSAYAANQTLYGSVDEVRIYTVGLSAGEIKKHYVEGILKYKLADR